MTQSFLARLLEKSVQTLHRSKGKFRPFLLASPKNYLAKEWDKDRALEGQQAIAIVSLNQESSEAGGFPGPERQVFHVGSIHPPETFDPFGR